MREIKFRGKRTYNGEWVHGFVGRIDCYELGKQYEETVIIKELKYDDRDYYVQEFIYADSVDPDTVGQYTGLKDKNEVEIYEGDIVTACWYDYEEPNYDMTGIVEFTEGWMGYWIADYDKKEFSELNGQGYYHWTIEVIDNIYDNPELMEGECPQILQSCGQKLDWSEE